MSGQVLGGSVTGNATGTVIAIDGPAGTGKSTAARELAARVGAHYLDTGAMYRAATLACLRRAIDVADAGAVAAVVDGITVQVSEGPDGSVVLLDGDDVSAEIRTVAVNAAVSAVSAVPRVRDKLVAWQRESATSGRVVVEGRDIGTVVFPAAPVKFYLTARPEVRAQRRYRQDVAAGRGGTLDEVLAATLRRDALDSGRATSPLRPAADAIHIDTSDVTLEQVVAQLVQLVQERLP